jgi:hypothetical protein
VAVGPNPDVEARFKVLEVFVVGPEERLDAVSGNGDALDWLYLLILQRLKAPIIA